MATLTIVSTPKSITIVDGNQNKLVVLKTENGIEFHSVIETPRHNKNILAIQQKLNTILKAPSNNRDNYKVRFERLRKQLTDIPTHSFITIKRVLEHKDNTICV
jgi:hypothetical protein